MRYEQCRMLHHLHTEMVKISNIPKEAAVVADYLLYLAEYVIEINHPILQITRLNEIFEELRGGERPMTSTEFEDQALLFHILMDIQDFLMLKADFVNKLDERQLERYWGHVDEKDAVHK